MTITVFKSGSVARVKHAVDRGAVDLRNMLLRRYDAVGILAVVCEDEQARRILVKTSDRCKAEPPQLRRQK